MDTHTNAIFPFKSNLIEFVSNLADEYLDLIKSEEEEFNIHNPDLEFTKLQMFDSHTIAKVATEFTEFALNKYTQDIESMEQCAETDPVTAGPLFINPEAADKILEGLADIYKGKEGDDWPVFEPEKMEEYARAVSALILIKIVTRLYKELEDYLDEEDSGVLSDQNGDETTILENIETVLHKIQVSYPEIILSASIKASESFKGAIDPAKMFMISMGMEVVPDEGDWCDADSDDSDEE